jgi:hypothetical protein
MDIEILTTKKKLTKAMVKQFEPAKNYDLSFLISTTKIAYYIRGLGSKFSVQTGMFESINGWRTFSILDWHKSTVGCQVYASALPFGSRGSMTKSFDTEKERTEWLDTYNKAKALALKNHLIL